MLIVLTHVVALKSYLCSQLNWFEKKAFLSCHSDKTLGVFHYRSTNGTYKLNYTMAQEACKETGGTIATFMQLAYAQQVALFNEYFDFWLPLELLVWMLPGVWFMFIPQAGYSLCAAGWLDKARVAYPMSFSNPRCGFGHVGIVDYGVRKTLSETWDTFCYRVKGKRQIKENKSSCVRFGF